MDGSVYICFYVIFSIKRTIHRENTDKSECYLFSNSAFIKEYKCKQSKEIWDDIISI